MKCSTTIDVKERKISGQKASVFSFEDTANFRGTSYLALVIKFFLIRDFVQVETRKEHFAYLGVAQIRI